MAGKPQENKRDHSHVCPICGQHTFEDWLSFDTCPICGIEDGFVSWEMDETEKVIPPNWVSIKEGRWIWNKFHCNVNDYALAHKKEALDRLDMDDND